jgi:hypothetical protein
MIVSNSTIARFLYLQELPGFSITGHTQPYISDSRRLQLYPYSLSLCNLSDNPFTMTEVAAFLAKLDICDLIVLTSSARRVYCRFFKGEQYVGQVAVTDAALQSKLFSLAGKGEKIDATGVAKLKLLISSSERKLHSTGIVQLEYEPAFDLLTTSLQATRAYDAREVKSAFVTIATFVQEHSIKKLILDFTRNTYDLPTIEYKQTVAQLTVGLLRTPLQKVARIQTEDPYREEKIATLWGEIKAAVSVHIDVRMFPTKAAARQWLLL